jgi:hypothetical protein
LPLLLAVKNYILHLIVRMVFVIRLLSMEKKDVNNTEKEIHNSQEKLYFQVQDVSNASGSVVTCGREIKERAFN